MRKLADDLVGAHDVRSWTTRSKGSGAGLLQNLLEHLEDWSDLGGDESGKRRSR